jgi:tetratricopeptide (TPR) repeat protein
MRLVADGAAAEALAMLQASADRLAVNESASASRLLVDAATIALMVGGPDRAVSIAQRAADLGGDSDGLEHLRAIVRLGDALSWAGRYDEASAAWQRASAEVSDGEPRILAERANALIRLGDSSAHNAAYRALVAARDTGDREVILDALNLVTVA